MTLIGLSLLSCLGIRQSSVTSLGGTPARGIWKVVNTPRWDALWKDLMNSTKKRVLNVSSIHASDLSFLPVTADLV